MSIEQDYEKDIEELKKGFEDFDVDKKGSININEFIEILEIMNYKSKNPFLFNLIEDLSHNRSVINNNYEITFNDLIQHISDSLNDSRTGIKNIFNLFSNNSDALTLGDIPQISREISNKKTENELRDLLNKTKLNNEQIQFDKFYEIMKKGDKIQSNLLSNISITSDKNKLNSEINNDIKTYEINYINTNNSGRNLEESVNISNYGTDEINNDLVIQGSVTKVEEPLMNSLNKNKKIEEPNTSSRKYRRKFIKTMNVPNEEDNSKTDSNISENTNTVKTRIYRKHRAMNH